MFRLSFIALLAIFLAFPALASASAEGHTTATSYSYRHHRAGYRSRVSSRHRTRRLSYAERVRLHRRYEARLSRRDDARIRPYRARRYRAHLDRARFDRARLDRRRGYRAHAVLVRRERYGRHRYHPHYEVAAQTLPSVQLPTVPAIAPADQHLQSAIYNVDEEAGPASLPVVSPLRMRLYYYYSPLRGTYASLLRQNVRDAAEGLHRVENEAELRQDIAEGKLVHLPFGPWLQPDPGLESGRQYARPWAVQFLRDLASRYGARFATPLIVTSAVRPASYQSRLREINGNAAPVSGIIASPHEFGASIDIGKKGMSFRELGWMRAYLLVLQQEGKVDVEEEFHQACFHITVYTSYDHAPVRRSFTSADLLAAQVP